MLFQNKHGICKVPSLYRAIPGIHEVGNELVLQRTGGMEARSFPPRTFDNALFCLLTAFVKEIFFPNT